MDIKSNSTVCFTGHRPKSIFRVNPYGEARRKDYQAIVDRIADFVYEMAENGYKRFITGGAQGFDQLAFWAVHKAKKTCPEIINDVYIPFKGQESRWAKTGIFSQKEYRQMFKLADHVYVCVQDIDSRDFKAVTRALMYRNKCMVNDSGYFLGSSRTIDGKIREQRAVLRTVCATQRIKGVPLSFLVFVRKFKIDKN